MTDIYDYLDRNLYTKGTIRENSDGTSSVSTTVAAVSVGSTTPSASTEVKVENLVSGEVDGNLSFTGGFIQSKNFITGSTGWRISANGDVEFSNGTFRGAVNATSGKFGTATNYWSVGPTGLTAVSASTDVIINYGKTDFDNTQTGFILGYDYSATVAKFYLGNTTNYLNWTGSALKMRGEITATSGQIGGTYIDSTSLTGGIIQTATDGDRLVMTDDSFASNNNPAFDCYNDDVCVGSLRPRVDTVGKGYALEAYEWGTTTIAAHSNVIYWADGGISGGQYFEVNIGVDGADHFWVTKDEDYGNIAYAHFNCRIDGSLNPPTGTGTSNGDIGRSDSTWDNAWIEDVNYQNLSDFSDERLKKNIKNIDMGLAEILALRPVNFKWKKDNKSDIGFIAQEARLVVPSMVKECKQKEVAWEHPEEKGKNKGKKIKTWNKILPEGALPTDEGVLTTEKMKLLPILVKAIQELNKKVDNLQKQVNLLI